MQGTVVLEEFSAFLELCPLEKGLECISGWCLAEGTEQWSTLSACDSLTQAKFSHKIHHTSALARSACWQREVCGAGGEGRTMGSIISELIEVNRQLQAEGSAASFPP